MSNLIYRRAKAVLDFKNALRFLGTNQNTASDQKVQVPYQPYHNFGTGNFAFSFWVYPVSRAATGVSEIHAILGWGLASIASSPATISLGLTRDPGNVQTRGVSIQYRTSAGVVFGQVNIVPDMTNIWNNIIIQRAGTTLQVWVNGVNYVSNAIAAGASYSAQGTVNTIGQAEGPSSFNGYLDEFGVYNRALTSDEITALFNGGLGANPPLSTFANIVSYWRFDSVNGRTLIDNTLLYNNLYNPGNGTLLNYTDAQVAAGGQPQSGQTAWVDHFTLTPTTVDPLAFGYSVTGTGTPVTRFSAEFIATAGTDINVYVPETGVSLTRIMSGWLVSPSVSPALTGTGRLAGTGTGWSAMTAPIAQRSVRAVIQNIQFAGTGGALVQLFSNAGGTFGIRGQINYNSATPTTAIIYIILDGITNAQASGDTLFQKTIPFTQGQDLRVETDGVSVTVSYGAETLVRTNLFQFTGTNALLALNGSNSSIDKFTITDYI